MTATIGLRDRDLRDLAAIVSEERCDVPPTVGLAPSLLADLKAEIPCDVIAFAEFDSGRLGCSFVQALPSIVPGIPDPAGAPVIGFDPVRWDHYWDCACCSYPDRTADLRSVTSISDFYSERQWRSVECGINRPLGFHRGLMLSLPPSTPSAGRTLRLFFFRQTGMDFSDRDRNMLTLLRPHLHQSYLDAERRRHPLARLTPRQDELMILVAAGHTNAQIARQLGISEGTVRTHLEHVFARLGVASRTAAVTATLAGR